MLVKCTMCVGSRRRVWPTDECCHTGSGSGPVRRPHRVSPGKRVRQVPTYPTGQRRGAGGRLVALIRGMAATSRAGDRSCW